MNNETKNHNEPVDENTRMMNIENELIKLNNKLDELSKTLNQLTNNDKKHDEIMKYLKHIVNRFNIR